MRPRLIAVSTPAAPQIERDEKGRPLPPPNVAPTSIKWAMLVPLCALGVLATFIVINSLDSPGPSSSTTTIPALKKVSGLTAASASPFAPYVENGEPPPDILTAVVIPTDTSTPSVVKNQGEATSYDRTLAFTSTASAAALYSFFRSEMAGHGWKIFSTGAPVGQRGVEVLSQKAGSDSWYWEEGVIISPTTFSATGAQSTKVTLRLYQASDGA